MVYANSYPAAVIVLYKDGSMDFTIEIKSGRARDVTCIDSNTIAVSTLGIKHRVDIIDLNKRSITSQINTRSAVSGIAYNDGHVTSRARPNLMSIVKSIDPSLYNTMTAAG
jgi:hypothetical protein